MKPIFYMLLTFCILMNPIVAQEKEEAAVEMEQLFPDKTIVFYAVSSVPELFKMGRALPVVKIADKVLDSLGGNFRVKDQANEWLNDVGLTMDTISAQFPGGLALGVYERDNVPEGESDLEFCMVVKLGRKTDSRTFMLEGVFRKIRNQIAINNVVTKEYPGYVITSFVKSNREVLSYTVFKSYLIITNTKNELVKTVYRMKEKRSDVFSDNMLLKITSDEQKRKHHVRFFVNGAEIGRRVRKMLPPQVVPYLKLLEPTGLFEIQGIYGNGLLGEKGVTEYFNVYFEEIKGAMSLMSGIGGLSFDYSKIPSSAFAVSATGVDLILLWDFLVPTFKKYAEVLPGVMPWAGDLELRVTEAEIASNVSFKDDILRNMDNSICGFSFYITNQMNDKKKPALAYAIKLFNKDKTVKDIVNFFNKGLKLQLSEIKAGDAVIYYRQFDEVYLAFVLIKDTLFVGTHYKDLEGLVEEKKNKGSVLDNPRFAAYIKDEEVKSISFVDYSKQFAETEETKPENMNIQFTLPAGMQMPDIAGMGKMLDMFGMKVRNRGNRVMYESVSPFPLQVILPAVASYLVLVEIPKYPERQEKRMKEETIAKLLQIHTQLELYSLENGGRYPKTLADLYPRYIDDLEVFDKPGNETTIKFKDEINKKTMFVMRRISLTDNLKANDIRIYQKNGMHSDGFFVLLNNGSVEYRSSDVYDDMVEQLTGNSVEIIE